MDFSKFPKIPSQYEQEKIIKTQLVSAAHQGDIEQLQVALFAAEGKTYDYSRNTALYEAINSDSDNAEEMVGLLVQYGANLYSNDFQMQSNILSAVKNDDVQKLKLYLLAGISEKVCNAALEMAVKSDQFNSMEMTCLLRNQGAYLNNYSVDDFFLAVRDGDFGKILRFGAAGLDHQHVTNRNHQTPIMVAAQYGRMNIIEYFAHEGIDKNAIDSKGWTAGDYALQHAKNPQDNYEAISFFINNQVPMNPQLPIGSYYKKENVPLIIWAAYYGLTDLIPALISNYGAVLDDVELIRGQTALIWAVTQGHVSTAIKLIELGANPDVINNKGVSLFDLAMNQNNTELLEYLLQNQHVIADEILLNKAMQSGNVGTVAAVLDAIPHVLLNDKVKAFSPVYQAVNLDYPAIVSLLLKKGFPFDQINDDNHLFPGKTPLFRAVSSSSIETLDVLLKAYDDRAWVNKVEIDADIERHLHIPEFINALLFTNGIPQPAYRFLSSLPTKIVNQLNDAYPRNNVIRWFKMEMKHIRSDMLALFGIGDKKEKVKPIISEGKSFLQIIADNFWYMIETIKQAFGLAKLEPVVPVSVEAEPKIEAAEPVMPMLPNELISKVLGQPTLMLNQPPKPIYPFWYQHRAEQDMYFVLRSISTVKNQRPDPAPVELEPKPVPVIFSSLNTELSDNVSTTIDGVLENNKRPNPEKLDEPKIKVGQP